MCLNEGGGPDILCVPWTKSLLTRMNFKKRRVNTKSCAPSQDIEEARRKFLGDLKMIKSHYYWIITAQTKIISLPIHNIMTQSLH